MSLGWQDITVEPGQTRRVAGDDDAPERHEIAGTLALGDTRLASYTVTWTEARPELFHRFDITGEFDPERGESTRHWIARALYSIEHEGYMVVDADPDTGGADTRPLARADIIDTDLAEDFFILLDAIFMGDPRLEELRS